jgi:hypothetical protein
MPRTLAKRLSGAFTAFLAALCVTAPAAPAAAPGVLGEWSFDEGAGQIAADAGPLALPGQLGSSALSADDDPTWVQGSAAARCTSTAAPACGYPTASG